MSLQELNLEKADQEVWLVKIPPSLAKAIQSMPVGDHMFEFGRLQAGEGSQVRQGRWRIRFGPFPYFFCRVFWSASLPPPAVSDTSSVPCSPSAPIPPTENSQVE